MGARDELHGHDPGPLPPPSLPSPTPQPEVIEEPGGSRPDRLFAVSGPQDRVQRLTVQQIVDIAPLPTLDDPAPQMVEQLPDVLRFFRALDPHPRALSANSCSRAAAGGTAGGSADDGFLVLAAAHC